MSPPDDEPQRPRLLLIDDDPISREVLSMMLEMHGYPVTSAESGDEALACLNLESPEVILMDTQMPGLSGLALVAALRAASRAKIIAISGSAVADALRLSADGFLLKPVQPEELDDLLAARASSSQDALMEPGPGEDPPLPEPLIDPQVLGKLKAIMPAAAVREVYQAVAADLHFRLGILATAMQAQDAAEVARIAHTIKGGSSMVGVTIVIQASSRLEFSNRNGTWAEELAQMQSALVRLERILGDEFLI